MNATIGPDLKTIYQHWTDRDANMRATTDQQIVDAYRQQAVTSADWGWLVAAATKAGRPNLPDLMWQNGVAGDDTQWVPMAVHREKRDGWYVTVKALTDGDRILPGCFWMIQSSPDTEPVASGTAGSGADATQAVDAALNRMAARE